MKTISSNRIQYKKPHLDEYLGDYNDKLATILVNNFSLKYLSSATINRLEAQTKFYELLEKYIQICEMLDSDKEFCVNISKEDQILYSILKKQYGQRITGKGTHYFLKLKLLFLPRLIHSFSTILFSSIVSRFKQIDEKKYDSIIRTYFDYRSVDENGHLKDQYFGELINDLKKSSKLLIVYKMLRCKDLLKFIKMKSYGFDAVALEYFLNIITISRAFIYFLQSNIELKDDLKYRGHDCSKLLQLFLNEDYLTLKGLGVFIEKEVAIKMFDLHPRNILLPYENQTWEKIYPYMKNILHQDAKITGYQHTGVSYKLLNYFPSKVEKHLFVFPDKLVTVGAIIKNLLQEQANYPSEIVVGGALRFSKHFSKYGDIEVKCPDKVINKKIVYAFSYDITKYTKIIDMLTDIFGNTEIVVLLKFHPDYVEEDILKSFKDRLPNNFVASGTKSWIEIFQIVDLVLYDDNSIAFEGIIHGVKTFSIADTEQIYDITRKFGFDSWKENVNEKDLIVIKDQLINGNFDKMFDVTDIHSYINMYFTKYNTEDHFNTFL
ncbi:hypothetical protein [Methanococcoides burtonii]|uniref:Uncharacterized protein n=1 Tax=Methanococcoides burtonii (strain DSM 6242 / NBRC 107633 / OCM 468 / ACE-M) TaxID=259564 RepID=Q12VM1_METBU|nr:hypothetical protein [Methanococcoides burtonii]ABE52505.1 Hypothetical protein Mbur_1601 [Methanococcoides burtonii DSM 6242]